jgi:hypothetical protein
MYIVDSQLATLIGKKNCQDENFECYLICLICCHCKVWLYLPSYYTKIEYFTQFLNQYAPTYKNVVLTL